MAGPATAALSRPAPLARPTAERLGLIMLWLTGATGSLVFIEPSPYEFVSLASLALFVLAGGLTLRPAFAPLAVLLILINTGYTLSASLVLDQARVVTWVVTSWYLALSALFFAAVVGTNTEARLAALLRGCMFRRRDRLARRHPELLSPHARQRRLAALRPRARHV